MNDKDEVDSDKKGKNAAVDENASQMDASERTMNAFFEKLQDSNLTGFAEYREFFGRKYEEAIGKKDADAERIAWILRELYTISDSPDLEKRAVELYNYIAILTDMIDDAQQQHKGRIAEKLTPIRNNLKEVFDNLMVVLALKKYNPELYEQIKSAALLDLNKENFAAFLQIALKGRLSAEDNAKFRAEISLPLSSKYAESYKQGESFQSFIKEQGIALITTFLKIHKDMSYVDKIVFIHMAKGMDAAQKQQLITSQLIALIGRDNMSNSDKLDALKKIIDSAVPIDFSVLARFHGQLPKDSTFFNAAANTARSLTSGVDLPRNAHPLWRELCIYCKEKCDVDLTTPPTSPTASRAAEPRDDAGPSGPQ